MPTEIQRERRARHVARREGLALAKSRRDGSFMLVDPYRNSIEAMGSPDGYGMTLEQIEGALSE